jgi:hypothetical protein
MPKRAVLRRTDPPLTCGVRERDCRCWLTVRMTSKLDPQSRSLMRAKGSVPNVVPAADTDIQRHRECVDRLITRVPHKHDSGSTTVKLEPIQPTCHHPSLGNSPILLLSPPVQYLSPSNTH